MGYIVCPCVGSSWGGGWHILFLTADIPVADTLWPSHSPKQMWPRMLPVQQEEYWGNITRLCLSRLSKYLPPYHIFGKPSFINWLLFLIWQWSKSREQSNQWRFDLYSCMQPMHGVSHSGWKKGKRRSKFSTLTDRIARVLLARGNIWQRNTESSRTLMTTTVYHITTFKAING